MLAHAAMCLVRALAGTVAVSGAILFILLGALTFSQILTFSGATNGIVELMRASAPRAVARWCC